jgi:hypothetical protein
MATGNIKGGKRNYAKPTTPLSGTANFTADSPNVTVTYNPSTLGPQANSYLVTATSNTQTVTGTITSSGSNVVVYPGGTYAITVAGQNYNGTGTALTVSNSLEVPSTYIAAAAFNASGTYTIPSGITAIAGYSIGAGGGGGGSNGGGPSNYGSSGGGGGSGAIVGFKDFTVTAGQTVTVTVGTGGTAGSAGGAGGAGGSSIIAYGGTDLATANGGNGGNAGVGNGGSGGTGSSNVAGAITISGMTGGRGANSNSAAPQGGFAQSSNTNITGSANIIPLLPSNNAYGSGTGGSVRFVADSLSGAGGSGNSNVANGVVNASTGVGSGGAGGYAGYHNSPANVGYAGFRGQVVLYFK